MGTLGLDGRKLFATVLAALGLWALAVPTVPSALANHPADSCLDVEPEFSENPTGTTHQVTATIKTTVTTVDPTSQTAQVTCTGPSPQITSGPVNIDFEITGPNDPDNSNSPDSPDLTCDIGAASPSCTVSYAGTQASGTPGTVPSTQAGNDVIRGWIDHDGRNPAQGGLIEADLAEGRDETTARGTGCVPPPSLPEPDCTDVVEKHWQASRLDCEPETATNQTGDDHTITCTARDEEGTPVQGAVVDQERFGEGDTDQNSAPPDASCTTGANGQCTFTHTSDGAGTTTYRHWLDNDDDDANTNEGDQTEAQASEDIDDTDTTTKTWGASRLDCFPETATNRSGETHTITCTASDEEGNGVPNTTVDAESTGTNDPDNGNNPGPDYTCRTDATGSCTFQHTGTQSGETTYRAWIDDDGNDDNVDEGDEAETQCAQASETTPACDPVDAGDDTEEPDDTDVVTKTWTAAAGAVLDCDDQSGDDRESNPGSAGANSNETYLCTVRDVSGNLAANETVRGEVRGPPDGNGINDPDATDSTSYESTDYTCTTREENDDTTAAEEGTCQIVVTQADSELGTAEICFWLGAVNQGATLCDRANEPTDEPEGNDAADQVEKTWFQSTPASASRLDCTPETDRNPAGSTHTITCTVTTAAGARVGNAEVDAEASGANDPDGNTDLSNPDFNCVTAPQDDANTPGDQTGTCQFTHGSSGPNNRGETPSGGTTTYRAWIDFDNNDSTTGRAEADQAEGQCSSSTGDEAGCAPPVPGTGCLTPPVPGEPDCTDVMTKTWGASRLDCTPETATNRTGDTHTVTCTARDENGNPVSGGRAHAEITGANDPDSSDSPETPDRECIPREDDRTTPDEDETGTCEFTHTGTRGGTSTYTVWMDDDSDAATPDRDADEGADAGDAPDEPAGGPNDAGAGEEPDETDVVTKRWVASRLDCTPETATNPPGRPHTITCSATDEEGNGVPGTRIQGEATGAGDPDNGNTPPPDFTCTTAAQDDPATSRDETETCEFTHTSNEGGQTTYRFWVDEDEDSQDFDGDRTEVQCAADDENGSDCNAPNNAAGSEEETDTTDVVTKNWAAAIDCEPETDTNPTGQPHTITCTVSAEDDPNDRVGGVEVDAEATGAGDPDDGDTPPPDFTCTTAAQDDASRPGDQTGTCSFTHTSPESGETVYRAWIDDDGDDENVDEGDADEPEGQVDQDDTDVVTKTWTASRLNCEPETATNRSGETHTITCTTTDEEGNAVGGSRVDAEATGAGDPDDGNTPPPDFTCTTAESDDLTTPGRDETGTCSFEHTSDESGTTTYRAWIDDDEEADNVNEGDTTEAPDAQDNDDTDVVTKRWAAARLDCQPETDTNPAGSSHTITCTARDEGGRPAGDQVVNAEADGANDADGDESPPDFTCTTATRDDPSQPGDETGTCSFTHQSGDETGTTTYRAWIDDDGDPNTSEADEDEARCASNDEGCTPPQGGAGDNAEPDNTDVVSKRWTAVVDCTPESDLNPTGSSHTVTCRASSTNGVAIQGQNIDAEATGDNDPDGGGQTSGNSPQSPDFTCTTDSSGECSFTHSGSQGGTSSPGQTDYRAWADDDGDATFDGDGSETADETDNDDTDVVVKNWTGPGLDCFPEQDVNPTGTSHEFTCTARDANSQPLTNRNIDVEATGANDPDDSDSQNNPDFTCNTGQDGSCTISHSGDTNESGTTLYRAWMDDGNPNASEADAGETREQNDTDNTDVVEKRWVAGRLDCTPETDTNPTGTSHQVTCTVRDGNNQTAPNTNVDVEVTGANDPDATNSPGTPDFTCTTGNDGSCTFTHGGGTGAGATSASGTTTYRAWVDADGVDSTTDGLDQTEARDEQGNGVGARPEPDSTDVVEKTWVAGRLDCTPETAQNPTGTSHTVTCIARDTVGNVVGGVNVDAEVTGANDRDGNDQTTSPDFTCTTSSSGSCTFTHGGGGNNGSTDVSGTSTYRAWIDSDGNDSTSEADPTETRDEAGSGAGQTPEVDGTDVVEKTWVTQPRTISCTPPTATNPTGTDHVVTCTVRDRSAQVVSGQSVTFSESGSGTFATQTQQTTDAAGQVRATTTSGEEGTQTIIATLTDDLSGNEPNDIDECDRAQNDPTGAPAGVCSTSVTKTWTAPQVAQPASLTLAPSDATKAPGTDHTITATVLDENGQPVEGAPIDWESSGAGVIESAETTTDENGVATAVVTSAEGGTQQVSASTAPCATGGDCSDTATVRWATGNNCTITGTSAGETLRGTPGRDVICGFGGNDTIDGLGGNDLIRAGKGRDRVAGGRGRDQIRGGGGKDVINGGAGRDRISGGSGNDAVRGAGGGDTLVGAGGEDRLAGGAGNDDLAGGDGKDVLRGGAGDDDLDGGAARDSCNGGGGRNTAVRCER